VQTYNNRKKKLFKISTTEDAPEPILEIES